MEDTPKKIRYIPVLSQIIEAAKSLPDPLSCGESTFAAEIGGTGREILFERIEVYRGDGSKTLKWTYKGRLFVDSKYINKEGRKDS